MDVRDVTQGDVLVATRIFEAALGENFGDAGRGAWSGYIEMGHILGGYVESRLVGTATQYGAELTVPGGAVVPVHAVTGVGVLPTHKRRGIARGLLRRQFEVAAADGAVAMVLEASEATIYGRFGYGPATVHVNAVLEAEHFRLRTPAAIAGSFEFAEGEAIAHYAQPLFDAWRRTRPGQMNRPPQLWAMTLVDVPALRNGDGELQWVFHVDAGGTPDGYVAYRIQPRWEGSRPVAEAKVIELVAVDPQVRLALLDFVVGIDLVGHLNVSGLAPDDGLQHRLVDPRRLRAAETRDGLWLRILDVPGALGARRWWANDELVLEVLDPDVPAAAGRWRLETTESGAKVERTDAPADITLGIAELGMLWLGGQSAMALATAGRIQGNEDALARATLVFRGLVTPQHTGEF